MGSSYEEYSVQPEKTVSDRKKIPVFVYIFLVLTSVISVLIASILLYIPKNIGKDCTEEVSAVVCRNVEKPGDSSSDRTFAPEFRYEYNDWEYKVVSDIYANPPQFNVGQIVKIHVNPDKPDKIYGPDSEYFIHILRIVVLVCMAVGLIPLIIAVLLFILTRDKKKKVKNRYA